MRTTQINFEVPETLLLTLNQNREEFITQTRLMVAMQLFKGKKLTLKQAAELANMTLMVFLAQLDLYQIPLIDYEPTELVEELGRFE